MFHLDNSSGVDTMPTVANKQSDTTKWFTEGDNVNPPSYPGQDWFNIMQAECLNILKIANITPKKTQLNQLSTAIQQIVNNAKASSATTTAAGIVQLSSAVNSEAENQAATPKAVKTAYDLANAALPRTGGTVINELVSTSLNAFRLKNSTKDISSLIRFDGDRLWFLFTNKGDANGNYNSMRPMSIHATTGAIDIGTALTIKEIPVLKVGDGGVATTALKVLPDFKSLSNNSGTYIAYGSKVPNLATPNAPSGTSNSKLTVTVRCDGSVSHYEVIENAGGNPKKWVGECYTSSGSLVIYWTEVVTTANMSSYQGLGYGQTWQDVLSSRQYNTVYTNSTGKPIAIAVSTQFGDGGCDYYIYVDDLAIASSSTQNGYSQGNMIFGIVPAGSTYKVTSSTGRGLRAWNELR